nr:hypothetical protein [Kibdelosporangium sp. MJ126-NF4]CTQ89594.1 hypothetical protein [Kibdelosporangium sp. MJ126-NF4]
MINTALWGGYRCGPAGWWGERGAGPGQRNPLNRGIGWGYAPLFSERHAFVLHS